MMKFSSCHPERPHFSNGLCQHCYQVTPEYRVKQNNGYRRRILRQYGFDLPDVEHLLMLQGGGCGICGRKKDLRKYHIDHDHKTNKLRGILCHQCNVAIGLLGDELVGLNKAVKYLSSPTTTRFSKFKNLRIFDVSARN